MFEKFPIIERFDFRPQQLNIIVTEITRVLKCTDNVAQGQTPSPQQTPLLLRTRCVMAITQVYDPDMRSKPAQNIAMPPLIGK